VRAASRTKDAAPSRAERVPHREFRASSAQIPMVADGERYQTAASTAPEPASLMTPNRNTAAVPTIVLDVVDSTNAQALRLAKAGERGPLWIVAKQQSRGRGRRGRAWMSPVGNLYATLMLTDPAPARAAPQLAFVAALALHDAAVAGAPALASRLALKWPNDLLCGGRKIAGILVEGEGDPIAVAIGIGVNCRHHPDATELPATDFAAAGEKVDAATLFSHLAEAMQARLTFWNRGAGFAGVRAAWLARALGLGQAIRVRLAEREATGCFETIDDAGRLVLRTATGEVEAVGAGDVFPFGQAG
jgi:BirA family transcriptional regulator, biotin operon repressor / biotin---[acetyl-CoA-carboxylase] ligase